MADNSWSTTPLGELCESERGITYGIVKVGDFIPGGIPVVRGGDIRQGRIECDDSKRVTQEVSNQFRRTILKGGEIVLNLIADPGHSAIVPSGLAGHNVSRDVAVIPLNGIVDCRFVNFFLRSKVAIDWLTARLQGSVTQKINLGTLRELPVPTPSLAEQKTIARILGALDDKIELSRRMNATLEAMARALFQSWFVDFDPVRAKLDGRRPVGLDVATAGLFPAHFQDAEDGKLPVGWRRAPIAELCAVNDWTLSKNDELDTLEYIEISEVSRGDIANITMYQRGAEPSRARRRLRHGDTVLSTVRPDRGSYFLALNPPQNRVASTGFAVITPTKAPWSFIHAAMTHPDVSEHLGQMADGGAYPAVRPEIIGAMNFVVPNVPKILEAFHRICVPLFEQAEANRVQSRTLAALRDTLLPKLLSGELSVL